MRPLLLAICFVLAACGGAESRPAARAGIPVLVYQDADGGSLARLHDAGYHTITLPELIRHLRGEPVVLPPHPFLLTADDGRRASLKAIDPTLAKLSFSAVMFVDAGRVDRGDPAYLRWEQLAAMQRSGRWDVQLEAGTGKHLMRYGPGRDDVGSFYTYRGTDEVLGGWRERVFGDLAWGERQLTFRLPGYRPLAFAPPYGNYGQLGTDDPEIPRLLLRRLLGAFPVVFTSHGTHFAKRGQGTAQPVERIEMPAGEGALLTSGGTAARRSP